MPNPQLSLARRKQSSLLLLSNADNAAYDSSGVAYVKKRSGISSTELSVARRCRVYGGGGGAIVSFATAGVNRHRNAAAALQGGEQRPAIAFVGVPTPLAVIAEFPSKATRLLIVG